MKWDTIQQLIRILAYTGGSFAFGEGVSNGEMYQAAVSGLLAIGAFVWWLVVESKKTA